MTRAVVWAWSSPVPVRMPSGKAYTARLVLFDSIGWGPHRCHWCDREIDWLPKTELGSLQVDHLDGDTTNDDITNLVASCGRCNSARGKAVLWFLLRHDHEAQARARLAGPIKTHFRCGHRFIESNIYVLGPKAHSRFCCLTCHRRKARQYWRLTSA